jgi:copper chaperone CopZ
MRFTYSHQELIPMTTIPAPATATFVVSGMSCHHCEVALKGELSKLPGIISVDVDVTAGTVTTCSDRPLDRADVATAVYDAGYDLA